MEYDLFAARRRSFVNPGRDPAPDDLAHLSPLGWEHINLTGDYHWETSPTLGPDQFRPLQIGAHAANPLRVL